MARTNANKCYRIIKTGDTTVRLDIYASDNDVLNPIPAEPEIVLLNSNCLETIQSTIEFNDLPLGLLSAPVLEMEFNINKSGTDFNNILKDPFRDYAVSTSLPSPDFVSTHGISPITFDVTAGNMFELYIDDVLVYAGFQSSVVDGNYDSEKYILKVEVIHCAKVISDNLKMEYLRNLVAMRADTGLIKESQGLFEVIYKDADTTKYVGVGATTITAFNFYFIRYSAIWTELNRIYDQMLYKVTRTKFNNTSGVPIIENVTIYKQNYSKDLGRGTEIGLISHTDSYILGFIVNKSLADRADTDLIIAETFIDKLEQYTNLWDFLTAYSKQMFRRYTYTATGFANNSLFALGSETLIPTEMPKLELDYFVTERAESTIIEKIDNDVDKIEVVYKGSRSGTDNNITAIFNNNIPIRNEAGKNSLMYSAFGSGAGYFDRFKMTSKTNWIMQRHFRPLYLAYYYFERPIVDAVYLTSVEIPILANHNINVNFGAFKTSDDFVTEVTMPNIANVSDLLYIELFKGALVDIANRSGGSLYVYSQSLLELFRALDYKQTNLEIVIDKTNIANYVCNPSQYLSYDASILAPPNDTNYFSNISDNFYLIKSETDLNMLIENGYKLKINLQCFGVGYA